jgi:hypothetical protein
LLYELTDNKALWDQSSEFRRADGGWIDHLGLLLLLVESVRMNVSGHHVLLVLLMLVLVPGNDPVNDAMFHRPHIETIVKTNPTNPPINDASLTELKCCGQ